MGRLTTGVANGARWDRWPPPRARIRNAPTQRYAERASKVEIADRRQGRNDGAEGQRARLKATSECGRAHSTGARPRSGSRSPEHRRQRGVAPWRLLDRKGVISHRAGSLQAGSGVGTGTATPPSGSSWVPTSRCIMERAPETPCPTGDPRHGARVQIQGQQATLLSDQLARDPRHLAKGRIRQSILLRLGEVQNLPRGGAAGRRRSAPGAA